MRFLPRLARTEKFSNSRGEDRSPDEGWRSFVADHLSSPLSLPRRKFEKSPERDMLGDCAGDESILETSVLSLSLSLTSLTVAINFSFGSFVAFVVPGELLRTSVARA